MSTNIIKLYEGLYGVDRGFDQFHVASLPDILLVYGDEIGSQVFTVYGITEFKHIIDFLDDEEIMDQRAQHHTKGIVNLELLHRQLKALHKADRITSGEFHHIIEMSGSCKCSHEILLKKISYIIGSKITCDLKFKDEEIEYTLTKKALQSFIKQYKKEKP